MNWLLIVTIVIMAWNILRGYKKGFLRIMYSLLSIIVTLIFVTVTTPYITGFLEQNTTLPQKIEEKCYVYIRDAAEKNMESEVQEKQASLEEAGVRLSNGVLEDILDLGIGTADRMMEESGAYEAMAKKISHFVISGIAFFVALLLVSVVLFFLSRMINLVAKLPLIRDVNHFFGIVAGALQGIVLVWLMMYLISVCCTSEFGLRLLEYINQSRILTWLYQNNLLLYLLLLYF